MEPDRLKMRFGTVLKELRLKKQVSQEKLALESGIDRTYISLLEQGKRNATIKVLFLLCETLGIKPSEFLVLVESSVLPT